jgi:hypothetical protein
MTAMHEASRTLVKSPPELWAELSDPASLSRHLGDFGEIRITRLEPETAVAWEGDRARGTVRLEPSGWGTRVVLTASPAGAEVPARPSPPPPAPAPPAPAPDPAPPAPAPDPSPLPPAARKRGLMARILRFLGGPQPVPEAPVAPAHEAPPAPVEPEPLAMPEAEAAADTEPAPSDGGDPDLGPHPAGGGDPEGILSAALDSLGQAHHRPFSRS